MEQPSSKSLLEGQTAALIVPGTVVRLSVQRGGRTLASVAATGGVDSLPALIEMAADSFDVDVWRVGVSGFQRMVVEDPAVVATCERLGIVLEALAPTPAVGG